MRGADGAPWYARAMAETFATADLCDAHGGVVRVIDPLFRDYGGAPRFAGPVTTLAVHDDNAFVRRVLEEPGLGRVLVIDGGGSVRTALVGGNLAALAARNGWSGIVVHGAVRDALELRAAPLGVRALSTCPRKSGKAGTGQRDAPLSVGGVIVLPGEMLWADEDGIVVGPAEISPGG